MRSLARMAVVGTIIGAVAVSGIVGAVAADGGAVAPVATADTPPPPAVEDFAYPNADQIFKDRGIKLKSGDGNIVLAPSCGPGLMEVDARDLAKADTVGGGRFCFTTTGASGRLTLELPSAYTIGTNSYAAHLVMASGTDTKIHDVQPKSWVKIGELTDPQQRPFTLLEITTTLVK
ncbi:hypothetical protein ACFV4F_15440 [Kitasatospora sp. NPDC059722]|uniref:hypothetical protein n=1 Tax=Kitasatospora sp. NPDC059722 TaxID=3346925 RepID=UPI00367C2567